LITKAGKVEHLIVIKSVSPTLDAEACRVLALTSPWIPGTEDDEPVPVGYTMPIDFRL
jgi:protein TonB